jgi:arylsulfatase A-like enzyme
VRPPKLAFRFACGVAGLALALALGCGRAQAPSLVLITLDTTRVDHLSCYGYPRQTSPNLDRLARQSVRYTRAWSTSSWTLPAHASLFTGLLPGRHGAHFDAAGDAVLGSVVTRMPNARKVRVGVLAEEFRTLAEILAERGYRTAAFAGGPWLHRSFGLMQGFGHVDDDVSGFEGRPAQVVSDRAIDWLRQRDRDGPVFLFVNYFDPHAPYFPPPRFQLFPGSKQGFEMPFPALLRGLRELTPQEREIAIGRYDAEIRAMDHHLGRLLTAVHNHVGPDALIVVTADHGESFGEGGRYGHTYWLSEELLRVPLLVRHPDRRGAGSETDAIVQLTDVLPLLADGLGFAVPDGIDGVRPGERESVHAELYREPTAAERYGADFDRDLAALIVWPFKLLQPDPGESVLTRLDATLHEQAVDAPDARERLARALAERRRAQPAAALKPATAEPELVEALRGLGYVE